MGLDRPYEVLVVDDDTQVLSFFTCLLRQPAYRVTTARSVRAVGPILGSKPVDLALVDLKLPDGDGLEVLQRIRVMQPQCPVIIMTGYSTVKSAVQALQLGAFDYVEKPFLNISDLETLINRALARSRPSRVQNQALAMAQRLGLITGADPRMTRLVELAYTVAQKPTTVLIQGETGTGKEVLARFIHHCSPRADRPFLAVNCAALAETLLESELFGHEKGAFTGAIGMRRGVLELADGGTLFLDEIGEASLNAQAKLLRLLETGTFQRLGGERTVRVDVRVVAATNVPLAAAVKQGTFRSDLYFRLDVVTLHVPPLRERLSDLPLLVEHFLRTQGVKQRGRPFTIAPEALTHLSSYPWPGNVRELFNVLLYAAVVSPDGHILPDHLPEKIRARELGAPGERQSSAGTNHTPVPWSPAAPSDTQGVPPADLVPLLTAWLERSVASEALEPLLRRLRNAERQAVRAVIRSVLRENMGDRQEAARRLGLTVRKIKYYLNER